MNVVNEVEEWSDVLLVYGCDSVIHFSVPDAMPAMKKITSPDASRPSQSSNQPSVSRKNAAFVTFHPFLVPSATINDPGPLGLTRGPKDLA